MHLMMLPFEMTKLAEEERDYKEEIRRKLRAAKRRTKRFVLGLGSGSVSKGELRQIKKQIKQTKPKTEEEKRIEQLAGKKWTRGKYYRGAVIGAGMGTGGQMLRAAIQKQKVLDPRSLTAAAAIGAIYGSALPAARRLADIEAAKAGAY